MSARTPIIVIGDAILDEVIELRELKMSAEGLVTYEEVSRKTQLGGAANVVKHLVRLGARVIFVHEGPWLDFKVELEDSVPIFQMLMGRRGIVKKQRFYCAGKKVMKVNGWSSLRETSGMSLEVPDLLLRYPQALVIACDNGQGMLTPLKEAISTVCTGRGLLVDVQSSQKLPDFSGWKGAHAFLNIDEFWAVPPDILTNFSSYHVKRGESGSSIYRWRYETHHPGFKVDAVDTVGAGDAYLAAWAVKGDIGFANAWAALSCTKIGTELPKIEELKGLLDAETFDRFCGPQTNQEVPPDC